MYTFILDIHMKEMKLGLQEQVIGNLKNLNSAISLSNLFLSHESHLLLLSSVQQHDNLLQAHLF